VILEVGLVLKKKGQGTFEYVLLLAGVLLIVVLAIVLLRGGIFGGGAKDVALQNCARELAQGTYCYDPTSPGKIVCDKSLSDLSLPDSCVAYNQQYKLPDGSDPLKTCRDVFQSTGQCPPTAGLEEQPGFARPTSEVRFPSPSPTEETSTLEVSSEPSNASVYFDGVFRGYTRVRIPEVATGVHVIVITKEGYQNHSDTIYIRPTPVGISRYHAVLQPIPTGSLSVSSNPSDSSVYVDGVLRGYTFVIISGLPVGYHSLGITHAGYNDHNTTVYISEGVTTNYSVTLSPLPVGALDIYSTPSNSSVFVDGVFRGYTPLFLTEIPYGYHGLLFTHEGYSNYSTTVYVNINKTTTVNATLSPLPVGALDIYSTPSNSSVFVDGVFRGYTPLFLTEIPYGYHGLLFTHEGYSNYSTTVYVNINQTTKVNVTLPFLPLGALSISSNPTNASVYVDGVFRGYTYLFLVEVPIGYRSIVLSKPNYKNYTTTVYVSTNQTTNVSATLTPS